MSQKSVIATILVVSGIVINSFVILNGLNIDPENSEHIARVVGMIMPGIFMATIAGLIIALIAQVFSKKRSGNIFFLTFSIFFLLTILMIAFGTSENQKIQEENLSVLSGIFQT